MSRELVVGNRVRPIIPDSAEGVFRLAEAVVQGGMAPKGMDTPSAVAVAMLHGLEIGLPPMTAIQRIAIVGNRPTLWGDGALGLVQSSTLMEWIKETISGVGDARAAKCEAKRANDPEVKVNTFSVADAKRAGLWGKSGPWTQHPDRMLKMRARAFTLRDGFADVLGGMYLREEIEEGPARIEPPEPQPMPEAKTESGPPEPPEPPEPEDGFDFDGFRAALDSCETVEAMQTAFERLTHGLPDGDDADECQRIFNELAERHWVDEGK
jgi:hypothetical protein